jgi:hypothetical protein
MRKKRKKKIAAGAPRRSEAASALHSEKRAQRISKPSCHMLAALAILTIFDVAEHFLAKAKTGHWLHLQGYAWLSHLAENPKEAPKLTIIDISKLLPQEKTLEGSDIALELTPRNSLAKILRKIAGGENVLAIGFDIDLSPESNGVVAPGTFAFLDECLQVSQTNSPVFLGIRRAEALGPNAWLGNPKYADMAVSINRPAGPLTSLPKEYFFPGSSRPLPGIAAAIARKIEEREPTPHWLARLSSEADNEEKPVKGVADFQVRSSLVDFRHLNSLRRQIVDYERVLNFTEEEARNWFSGKAVLIGDAAGGIAGDMTIVPGQNEPVSGLFAHAAAIATQTISPLREFGAFSAWLLNISFAIACLGVQCVIIRQRAPHSPVTHIPLQFLLMIPSLAFPLMAAASLMKHGIMWLGVWLVCATILCHNLFEIFYEATNWKAVREAPLTGWASTPDHDGSE